MPFRVDPGRKECAQDRSIVAGLWCLASDCRSTFRCVTPEPVGLVRSCVTSITDRNGAPVQAEVTILAPTKRLLGGFGSTTEKQWTGAPLQHLRREGKGKS